MIKIKKPCAKEKEKNAIDLVLIFQSQIYWFFLSHLISNTTQNGSQQFVDPIDDWVWSCDRCLSGRPSWTTAIGWIQSSDVFAAHSQSLSHNFTVQVFECDDRVTSITRKSSFWIMHYWSIIVLDFVVCDDIKSVSIKIVLCSRRYFSELNFDILIAFSCWLHVVKSHS